MHFRCRVWQAQIVDHVLLLQHCSDLYEVMRHKNAAHQHLQWYFSCHLLHQDAGMPDHRLLCQPFQSLLGLGAFILFHSWDTHVMSAGSAISKPSWIGSFHPVSLMGHSCDVCWVSRCESTNLLTSSVLFLLSFSKFTSSNNYCKSIRYLWRQPV